jgi:hypothetical protein
MYEKAARMGGFLHFGPISRGLLLRGKRIPGGKD